MCTYPGWWAVLVVIKEALIETCPEAMEFVIAYAARYLGVWLGPGSANERWDLPLAKYVAAASHVKSLHTPLAATARFYNMAVLPTLLFLCQLLSPPGKEL